MTQCWAQEPDQRPTFHKIQDQLQLFKSISLTSISQCTEAANPSAVINEGFEGKFDSSLKFSGLLSSVNCTKFKWVTYRRHFTRVKIIIY